MIYNSDEVKMSLSISASLSGALDWAVRRKVEREVITTSKRKEVGLWEKLKAQLG